MTSARANSDAPSWEPHIATSAATVLVPFERLGVEGGQGRVLASWLIANAEPITFPATDPSTRVRDDQRGSQTWAMRYCGPNFFALGDKPPVISALQKAYGTVMPHMWQQTLGITVRAMGLDERAAEAFVTNPRNGESADPHTDTRPTVAGYPLPGAGLIISHCLNARDIDDIRSQPATLVLPRAESLVFFRGTEHPHVGISPDIMATDDDETRAGKFQAAIAQFTIVDIIHNLGGESGVHVKQAQQLPLKSLHGIPGFSDRVVISFNFDDGCGHGTSLDKLLSPV